MELAHPHPPEALIEPREHAVSLGLDRWRELVTVFLLALATLATAWCGYQASAWSGDSSKGFASSAETRIQATQASTQAGQRRIDDQLYFNGWLDAYTAGDKRLAEIYRRRFRPELEPAFKAWLTQPPATNPHAAPGPLYVKEYRPVDDASKELHATADEHFSEATNAKIYADRYILATVFMAAVLFFAGISLRLDWHRLQYAVLGMACALIVGG